MSLSIRLQRVGKKDQPLFRIVVDEKRSKLTGAVCDNIGFYNPKAKPVIIKYDKKALQQWIAKGAQPSETVRKILSL